MKRNIFLIIVVFLVSLFWFMFPAQLGKHYYQKAFNDMQAKKDPLEIRRLLKKAKGYNPTYKPIDVALSISYADEGLVYLEKGNYQQALALICKAITACPFYTTHYVSLGAVYAKLENYEQAEVAYKMALEMNAVLDQLDKKSYNEWKSYLAVDEEKVHLKIKELK